MKNTHSAYKEAQEREAWRALKQLLQQADFAVISYKRRLLSPRSPPIIKAYNELPQILYQLEFVKVLLEQLMKQDKDNILDQILEQYEKKENN